MCRLGQAFHGLSEKWMKPNKEASIPLSESMSNWSRRSISAGKARKKKVQKRVARMSPCIARISSALPLSSLGLITSVAG